MLSLFWILFFKFLLKWQHILLLILLLLSIKHEDKYSSTNKCQWTKYNEQDGPPSKSSIVDDGWWIWYWDDIDKWLEVVCWKCIVTLCYKSDSLIRCDIMVDSEHWIISDPSTLQRLVKWINKDNVPLVVEILVPFIILIEVRIWHTLEGDSSIHWFCNQLFIWAW